MTLRSMYSFVLLATLILGGCSASGVVASPDPRVKLQQAEELYDRQGRFVPAQRLIQEALAIFEERGDEAGIAEAYRQLGFLYRAPVSGNRTAFVPDDFAGTTNGVENRYLKSMEYFERSVTLFNKIGRHDMASNLYFSIGQSYASIFRNKAAACASFEESRVAQRKAAQAEPGLRPALPPQYRTFDELIEGAKREVGCS